MDHLPSLVGEKRVFPDTAMVEPGHQHVRIVRSCEFGREFHVEGIAFHSGEEPEIMNMQLLDGDVAGRSAVHGVHQEPEKPVHTRVRVAWDE